MRCCEDLRKCLSGKGTGVAFSDMWDKSKKNVKRHYSLCPYRPNIHLWGKQVSWPSCLLAHFLFSFGDRQAQKRNFPLRHLCL